MANEKEDKGACPASPVTALSSADADQAAPRLAPDGLQSTGAVDAIKAHIASDPDTAWGWHCNIVVPIMDTTGASHQRANEAAAFLMWHLFDYDITSHPLYEYGKSGAQLYYERRIAAEREEDASAEAGK